MSSFLCEGFLQSWQAGSSLHRGARASHYRGLSRCGAQAPDAQAQQLWLTGPAAPRHAGSSRTRGRTLVPCIGRQIPNQCATREAPVVSFFSVFLSSLYLSLDPYICTPIPFILKSSCLCQVFVGRTCRVKGSLSYVVLSVQPLLQVSAEIVGPVEHLSLEMQTQLTLPETPALGYLVGF